MIPYQDLIDQFPKWVFLIAGLIIGAGLGITVGFLIAHLEMERHRDIRAKSREYAQDTIGNPKPRGTGDERIRTGSWNL